MHSMSGMGVNNVPAFLTKIWQLVDDPATDEMIAWDPSGSSFHVFDQARFSKEILPLYFKHNNMASFIRQLNMYGFRKVVHIGAGAIKCETDDVEFHHPYFVRGEEQLLENIKRKASLGSGAPNVKPEPGIKLNPEDVTRVLTDVQLMKGKQDNMSSKMDKMKKENEALWREVASLRNKHMKQQQIVNKLIQFMIHLVGGNSGLSGASLPKRKMPLMINDASQVVPAKRPRYNKQLSIEELADPTYVVSSPPGVLKVEGGQSASGPIIQEVVDASPRMRHMPSSSVVPTMSVPSTLGTLQSAPSGDRNSDLLGASLDSTDLNHLLQSVSPSTSSMNNPAAVGPSPEQQTNALDKFIRDNPLTDRTISTLQTSKELKGHVDTLQDDLDSLKDLLGGNFDPNMVINLFSGDGNTNVPISVENLIGEAAASSSYHGDMPTTSGLDIDPNMISGNELVQYHPQDNFLSTIADLSDIIGETESSDLSSLSSMCVPTTASSNATATVTRAPDEDLVIDEIDPMSFINTDSAAKHDLTSHFDMPID